MKAPKPDAMAMQFSAITMAWIAFLFTLLSSFYCTFTVQDLSVIQITNQGNTTTAPIGPYYAGLWNFRAYSTVYASDGDTLYVQTYAYCSLYPEGTEMDAKWKTAQAFAIIATILGGLAALAMSTTCCDAPTEYWKSYAGVLVVTCISQGLALLFLNSNACAEKNTDLKPDTESGNQLVDYQGQLSKCHIGSGGILAAVAICVWFLAAVFSSMGNKCVEDATEEGVKDVETGEVKDEAAEMAKETEGIAEQAPQEATY
jgi:hypothetical protein